jgi:CTP-dependent riboflavin kinase
MNADNYFSEALGVALVPGSLNVYAPGLLTPIIQQWVGDAGACRRAGFVRACACTVGGIEAFILNVHPGNEQPGILQPATMYELFSTLRLRATLGLTDGSQVRLVFDPASVRDYRPR